MKPLFNFKRNYQNQNIIKICIKILVLFSILPQNNDKYGSQSSKVIQTNTNFHSRSKRGKKKLKAGSNTKKNNDDKKNI